MQEELKMLTDPTNLALLVSALRLEIEILKEEIERLKEALKRAETPG